MDGSRADALSLRRRLVSGLVVLAAIVLLLSVCLNPPAPADTVPAVGNGDVAAYQQIIERMRSGEEYYPAAHDVLIAEGYGARSVFNWRTPAWPWLLSTLPPGWGQGLLGLVALGGLLMTYRMMRADGGAAVALISTLAVALSLGGIAVPESVVFTEVAAGALLLASVAAYGNGWRAVGVVGGLAALFLRELAAPYVLVCVVLAFGERRWREAAGWGAGLVAYAAYFLWHWWMVSQLIAPGDPGYAEGWVQFGGAGFLLAAAGFNGLLALAPAWVAAFILPLGILGLWAWPKGTRAMATLAVYLLLFAVVGKPFNTYWGALFTPVLMLGFGWLWPALASVRR